MKLRGFAIAVVALAMTVTPGCGKSKATATAIPATATTVPSPSATTAPAVPPTTAATATTAPTATPVPTVAVVVELGGVQSMDEGGFSFAAVPGFELTAFGGFVEMLAPGADSEVGPTINIMGYTTEETTVEAMYEELKGGTDLTVGKAEPITIAGVPGLAADLSGVNSGTAVHGRVLFTMVTPTRQFAILACAPEAQWSELAPVLAAVADSVEFFEPVAYVPTLDVASGMYVYSNANSVRDLVVYDGTLYAATLGGVVAWDLSSGLATKYTTLDGMGHISAHSIAVCDMPEPRIVVGTYTGLSFFDPATGQWDSTQITPEASYVATNRIDRIACDAAGDRLLLGYSGLGVVSLADGAWTRYTDKEGLSWNGISDIAVSGADIWVASGYNGISRIAADGVTVYNEATGMPSERASAVLADDNGDLWVGTTKGLARLSEGAWTLYSRDTTPGVPSDITEMELAPDGTIWVASTPWGAGDLCQFDPVSESCLTTFRDPNGKAILALALDESGRAIYGTSAGITVLDGGSAQPLVLEGEQLASNFVDAIASDPLTGLLWVGTDAGTHRLDPAWPDFGWETYTVDGSIGNNPGGNWAEEIATSVNGATWFVFTNGRASRYLDGQWTVFEDYYMYDAVTVDGEGNVWLGDDSKAITVLDADGNVVMTLGSADGLPGDDVRALLTIGDTVWIGLSGGLAKYEGGETTVLFDKNTTGLTSYTVLALAEDADGNLLVGTMADLLRYDGANWTRLIKRGEQGFTSTVTALAVAPDGRIWMGSGNGVFYSDDGSLWTLYTTADGLTGKYVTALACDQYGSVWIGGGGSFIGGGLVRIVP